MPAKYHIDVDPAESRFEPVSKLNSIEQDRCLGCLTCAKRDCIYDAYVGRRLLPGQLVDSSARLCKACLRCVQECRNDILAKALNPAYVRLGNDYWTPDIILSLWNQAQTGKIPVSGAGYGGPFSGAGFDDMWTDMSEIVRPTRDGIHGREYINTGIDIGRKPDRLHFADGTLMDAVPPQVSIPLPILLEVPARARAWPSVRQAVMHAARQLQILAYADGPAAPGAQTVPRYRLSDQIVPDPSHRMLELELESNSDQEEVAAAIARTAQLTQAWPNTVVAVNLPLQTDSGRRVVQLAQGGVGVIRLMGDANGRVPAGAFIKDLVRESHLALVQASLRDCVTLLAGGGIAMAEHVAKLIACGADGVVVDEALLVALECRLCGRCREHGRCEVAVPDINAAWGAQRIENLMGAWHAQLIEVLGAMGLREVRRLRGEVGRVMFFKDLEAECFGPLFGKRK